MICSALMLWRFQTGSRILVKRSSMASALRRHPINCNEPRGQTIIANTFALAGRSPRGWPSPKDQVPLLAAEKSRPRIEHYPVCALTYMLTRSLALASTAF